ncbi:hypothetical protein Taro_053850 [Colocasia esculenta]|uniref:Uncharacterized protein n=1 Tax=Colocasia esculenta TaxID=4460 RepID=A0A843XNU6_COLES|nr:hypothetical protein [Colocasia esculenta]
MLTGGDIRAWDWDSRCKSIEDGGDVQQQRHPFSLATCFQITSMVEAHGSGVSSPSLQSSLPRPLSRITYSQH